MELKKLQELAENTKDQAYIDSIRAELVEAGYIDANPLDEGIVDLARNIGHVAKQFVKKGVKTGTKTFLTYLFSGTNANKMAKDMHSQFLALTAQINRDTQKLPAEKRTPELLMGKVSSALRSMLGPIASKIFRVVLSNDKRSISVIENPKVVSGKTEPLVKVSLLGEPGETPDPNEEEFIGVTFSESLGKRLFALRSTFAKMQDGGPQTHSADTTVHNGGAAGGSPASAPAPAKKEPEAAAATKTSAPTAAPAPAKKEPEATPAPAPSIHEKTLTALQKTWKEFVDSGKNASPEMRRFIKQMWLDSGGIKAESKVAVELPRLTEMAKSK